MASVKVYLSNATVNSEIRKKQQHVKDILNSLRIEHDVVDVLDPRNDEALKFMHSSAKPKKPNQKPTPPQIFNGEEYCGDYEKFSESVEWDQLYEFLKLEDPHKTSKASVVITGEEEEGKEKEDQQTEKEGAESKEGEVGETAENEEGDVTEDDAEKSKDDGADEEEEANDDESKDDVEDGDTEKDASEEKE